MLRLARKQQTLVQTWVPKKVHRWMKTQARKANMTLAAWMRLALEQRMRRT